MLCGELAVFDSQGVADEAGGGEESGVLWIIEVGYLSGILYKLTGHCDWRVWLYVFNMTIVGIDLALYYRYRGGRNDKATKGRNEGGSAAEAARAEKGEAGGD